MIYRLRDMIYLVPNIRSYSYAKRRTGCLYQINDHLWEGSYHPTNSDGKREGHTVYAKTREKCEKLLEAMIEEVRDRIKAEKEQRKNETETVS